MLTPANFTQGENESQDYYFFKNEVTQELVQIIRNKREAHWFGSYANAEGNHAIIPVYTDESAEVMLLRVSDWYNDGKLQSSAYKEIEEAEDPKRISKSLEGIRNMFGEFPVNSAKRIQHYLDEPTVDRWDDIAGILIDPDKILWQALLEEDSSFPRSGRAHDITGKIVKDWTRIPQPFEVLRIIKKHTQAANKSF